MKHENSNQNKRIFFIIGLGITLVSAILFLILGTDSIFINHDQMDGEMICYILHAKYLFDGSAMAEFMNGMAKTALTPPAPIFVLFFKVMSPFYAFLLMRYITMAVAYIGMFLLLKKRGAKDVVAMILSVIFAYAPFLHVYGFSMFGVPLFAWAYLCIEEKKGLKDRIKYFICIMFLCLGSSLVLSGFAILICAGVRLINNLLKKETKAALGTFEAALVTGITYLLCNISFVMQVLGLGSSAYETHKNEATIEATPFIDTFANALLSGDGHSSFNRAPILLFVVCMVVTIPYWIRSQKEKTEELVNITMRIRNSFWSLMFIALFEALYSSPFGINIRNSIGGAAKWFQLSRIDWIAPAIIVVMLGDTINIMSTSTIKPFIRKCGMTLGLGVAVITFGFFIMNDTWKDNLKVMVGKNSELLSWDEYYAPDVLSQVDEYLRENTGKEKSQYHVASLGINPAAALYNGFYCLDGYSNNYDVNYKHDFRRIIAPELEKNDYIKQYFDEWGNRCYLMSSQTPGYFTIEKGGFYFDNYEINVDAFKEMGGDYILSAAYINNAEEQGLTLLNEEPFETDKSYYKIYIYGVK